VILNNLQEAVITSTDSSINYLNSAAKDLLFKSSAHLDTQDQIEEMLSIFYASIEKKEKPKESKIL